LIYSALIYSIVIPAYNESVRIRPTLHELLRYISEQNWDAEILVVNDGSSDDTAQIVREYGAVHPQVLLIENPGNRGKGFSVRNGMLHARGDICLFTDADLSSPITEAPKLFDAIDRGADIAIGSRWLQTELQTGPQPLYRQLFGRIFNLALRLILGLRFADTQCGFKAFRRDAARRIFPLQKIERWGFDPEILFLARRAGLRVQEVPVLWAHSEGTRLHPLRDGLRMFVEVLRIRWNAMIGQPARPTTPPGQSHLQPDARILRSARPSLPWRLFVVPAVPDRECESRPSKSRLLPLPRTPLL
jgi:dolichyl-phosphate beta-glucosyltransferase